MNLNEIPSNSCKWQVNGQENMMYSMYRIFHHPKLRIELVHQSTAILSSNSMYSCSILSSGQFFFHYHKLWFTTSSYWFQSDALTCSIYSYFHVHPLKSHIEHGCSCSIWFIFTECPLMRHSSFVLLNASKAKSSGSWRNVNGNSSHQVFRYYYQIKKLS